MNKKRLVLAVGIAAAAILTVQSITASNMGFKLNYQLLKATDAAPGGGTSLTGRNVIALPDFRQAGLNNASQLLNDIGLLQTQRVERYKQNTDLYEFYSGRVISGQVNFNLTAGEGVRVRMNTSVPYIIVGSDDPSLAYILAKATDPVPGGTSLTGRNLYAYNYHQTATTASQLLAELGLLNVQRIEHYKTTTDLFEFYSGRVISGQVNFTLNPGEAYRIRMNTTVTYTPSHY